MQRITRVPIALLTTFITVVPATAQQATDLTSANASHASAVTAGGPQPVSTPPSSQPQHEDLAPRGAATVRQGEIAIDGVLDEGAWAYARPIVPAHQRQPVEGGAASQRTEVRIVYDEEAIYIGARMYDELGAAGVTARRGRRDTDNGSDFIYLLFDPYHDHQSVIGLGINPTGLRYDEKDGDTSWDPIWHVATSTDAEGWIAEARIPFSQLRFEPASERAWGLQVERYINRLNELQVWSFWGLDEQGGASRYGHLDGIATPATIPDRLELMPYVVAQAETRANVVEEDPFAQSSSSFARVGVDLRYQLSSSLTLSATINPDFGQAEVDPAVVNLSAFETFFPEKREFFIEGGRNFGYGSLWCFTCSDVSSLGMLFTRRIGRAPAAVGLAAGAGDYYDAPSQTTILGAAKLTGRTADGWTIGLLNAVTEREIADVSLGAERLTQEIEPLTNYFVARVRREAMGGDLDYGLIATSVIRNFDDPALSTLMNRHSEGLGLDAEYWWADRRYHLLAQVALTNVAGYPDAIAAQQRAPARYLHRPDRDHGSNGLFTNAYDPTLTRMTGYGWYTRVAKEAGEWRWEAQVNGRSPGFENNDIAFLTRADYVWSLVNLNRTWNTPTSLYRSLWVTAGTQNEFDYGGDLTSRQGHLSLSAELPNYWNVGLFSMHRPEAIDFRATRGGAAVRTDAESYVSLSIDTDSRRSLGFGLYPDYGRAADGSEWGGVSMNMSWTPVPALSLTMGPSYSIANIESQFVTSVDDPTATRWYGQRHVFGELEQRTLSFDTRMNITFTPNMTLQLFAQPLIASSDYSEWKEYERPRDNARLVYGADVGTTRAEQNGEETTVFVDPDGAGPAAEFSFAEPDFNLRSLRGNAVFRWEYRPGSTLYLVWTQQRADAESVGDFDFGRDRRALFDAEADNVFLVKVSYWLGI